MAEPAIPPSSDEPIELLPGRLALLNAVTIVGFVICLVATVGLTLSQWHGHEWPGPEVLALAWLVSLVLFVWAISWARAVSTPLPATIWARLSQDGRDVELRLARDGPRVAGFRLRRMQDGSFALLRRRGPLDFLVRPILGSERDFPVAAHYASQRGGPPVTDAWTQFHSTRIVRRGQTSWEPTGSG